MALLDALLLRERRALTRAWGHAEAHHYDKALAELADYEGDLIDANRHQLRAAAIDHFGAAAQRASDRDEGPRARARLDRAKRFATPLLRPRLHELEWSLRVQQLSETRSEHLVQLVQRGETERRRWTEHTDPSQVIERWASESHRGLLEAVGQAWGLGRMPMVNELLYAEESSLSRARPLLAKLYPDDLAESLPLLGAEFVRAVLLLAAGRPDRAALPLAECADEHPLVCFERARAAHLLDLAPVARTSLRGFAARAGGHRRIRRLYTGVFLAQMEVACGDNTRALQVLGKVPIERLGGRPALMYSRMLLDHGEPEQAHDVLRQVLERHPNLEGAKPLLAEAAARCAVTL